MTKRDNPRDLVQKATELRNDGHALEAVEVYKRAADLFDQAGQPLEATECIHMIGVSYKIENNKAKAMPYYEDAVKRFTDLGRLDKVGSVQRDIGIMLAYHKEYHSALEWLRKSELALAKTDNLNELGITQSKIGLMYIYLGDYAKAEQELNKGLNTIGSADKPHNFYKMTALLHLAALEMTQEHYETTLKYINEANDLLPQVEAEEGSMDRRRCEILGIRAHAEFGLGRVEEASRDTIDSLKLLEDVSDDAAAVVYANINAAKLLDLFEQHSPDDYINVGDTLATDRIRRLSPQI